MNGLLLQKRARMVGLTSLALGAFLLLPGCASMTEEECLTADWRLMGYEDAMAGRSTSTISQHRRACAAVGVSPDLDLYQAGHREGARLYCTPINGYRTGTMGTRYQSICPADLERDFMTAFQDGRELYELTSNISHFQSEVRKHKAEITRLRDEIETLEEAIVDADSSADLRRANLREISTLGEKIATHEVELAQAQRSIAQLELTHYYLLEDHRLMGY